MASVGKLRSKASVAGRGGQWTQLMRDRAIVNRIMKSVKSSGGKADHELGRELWRRGLRYRRRSKLTGKPDLVFAGPKVVIFVDGDFWHGRYLDRHRERGDFSHSGDYWFPKLEWTIERDRRVSEQLADQGWLVIRQWESDVLRDLQGVADSIEAVVNLRKR